jgi:carboxy-cis,cis-muconate cyclase
MTHHPEASKVETRTRAIFCLAAQKAPYNLYCNPFYEHAGHGSVFSVDGAGTLKECIQNYEYAPDSAIHGMVFDPAEEYLYSADMWGNKIWCHKKNSSTGKVETVGFVDAPKHKDQPRWVAMHPSGNYLYVLMEHGNTLGVYIIDPRTHLPVYTNISYPLVPECKLSLLFLFPTGLTTTVLVQKSPSLYRSDVCVLTPSSNTLFATSRSNKAGTPGYISAFSLTPSGSIERQLCLQPTTTSGGHSNAVSFYPGSKAGEEWMALTDDECGFVEMYRWDGKWLARVARCEVKEPGFGMNAVWFD